MKLFEQLKERPLFFDGAMGTLLQERGLQPGELPEILNLTRPEVVKSVYSDYCAAMCDIITANTFGANKIKLKKTGYTPEEVVSAALSLARRAIDDSARTAKPLIALDIGPTGKLLAPFGTLSFDESYDAFAQQVKAGVNHGADLIIIETMTDIYEMKAAVLAAKENSGLPVFASFSFDENEKLLTGGTIACAVALLEGLGVDALGINCGFGPETVKAFVGEMSALSSTPILVMPNAGMPHVQEGKTVFDIGPQEFARQMKEILAQGAQILGGCCGTGPEHIRQTIECCQQAPAPVVKKDFTIVSSYSASIVIGGKPVVIGENINPTGRKQLKQALLAGDVDCLVDLAIAQRDAGASILDVNVGVPGIDEAQTLLAAVTEIQTSVSTPLQLDSASPAALEKSLRYYNGKAAVNSVNGKRDSLDALLPLVKKYGGVVVGLTLDENGIPKTPEGRLEIAERIVQAAADYGIEKKDILIDALTLTVGASPEAARITLDSMALIKKKLGVKTVLGISNISYGLPHRDVVNATFLAQALARGLDACIINPESAAMMNTYYSNNTLNGFDSPAFEYGEYIDSVTKRESHVNGANTDMPLYGAITGGLSQRAYELTVEALKTASPQQVVADVLVPALDSVGKGFENKTLFLPQLMKSAQAAQNAFNAIKEKLESEGKAHVSKGTVILATVKGDIHDIGKNIVKIMLENYGFAVIDLGKNVSRETVLETVRNTGVHLVGLSALMTTTLPEMESTIALLHEYDPSIKVMAGGAVLTTEYAQSIGADYYAADAMAAVQTADNFYS